MHVGISRYGSCVFTPFPPFHVALPFLASPCALVGDKQSAGVLGDPRFHQAGASALGSGPGGRRPLARPPAGAARRPQWPRDSLRRHATTGLRTLSGKIVLLSAFHQTGAPWNSLKTTAGIWFFFPDHIKSLLSMYLRQIHSHSHL